MKKQQGQIWETRPLDCWKLAKEIRQSYDESIADKDQILGQGMTSFVLDWARAFKSIRVVEDNPVGAMMAARTEAFSSK